MLRAVQRLPNHLVSEHSSEIGYRKSQPESSFNTLDCYHTKTLRIAIPLKICDLTIKCRQQSLKRTHQCYFCSLPGPMKTIVPSNSCHCRVLRQRHLYEGNIINCCSLGNHRAQTQCRKQLLGSGGQNFTPRRRSCEVRSAPSKVSHVTQSIRRMSIASAT